MTKRSRRGTVDPAWESLLAGAPAPKGTFSTNATAGVPGPVARWLRASVAPGTPLHQAVAVELEGELKLRGWARFTSRLYLAPVTARTWRATARMKGLPVKGHDQYRAGEGEMRWKLLGAVPVVDQSGDDVARSLEAVLGMELGLCPTAFGNVTWSAVDDTHTDAMWSGPHGEHRARYRFGPDRRVACVWGPRWGDVNGDGTQALGTFVGVADAHRTFGGITVMSRFHAGWGTPEGELGEGEFFRAEVKDARWL